MGNDGGCDMGQAAHGITIRVQVTSRSSRQGLRVSEAIGKRRMSQELTAIEGCKIWFGGIARVDAKQVARECIQRHMPHS